MGQAEVVRGQIYADMQIRVPVENGPLLVTDGSSAYSGEFWLDRMWLTVELVKGHWVIETAELTGRMRTSRGKRGVRRGSAVLKRPLFGGDWVPEAVVQLLREAMWSLPRDGAS